ncbi:MAG: S6e family ribosomal protein [Candidatus Micrarchaeota archaeon]
MKIVFSEGKESFQKDYEGKTLIGMKIGEEFDGGLIGLDGYKLKISGGSNKEGTAMRVDVKGTGKTKALLSGGPGIRFLRKGKRVKKMVAGNTVSDRTAQVNAKITAKGSKTLADLGFTPKPKEAKKAEEKKDEKKK